MIISIDKKQLFEKMQYLFMIKTLNECLVVKHLCFPAKIRDKEVHSHRFYSTL